MIPGLHFNPWRTKLIQRTAPAEATITLLWGLFEVFLHLFILFLLTDAWFVRISKCLSGLSVTSTLAHGTYSTVRAFYETVLLAWRPGNQEAFDKLGMGNMLSWCNRLSKEGRRLSLARLLEKAALIGIHFFVFRCLPTPCSMN